MSTAQTATANRRKLRKVSRGKRRKWPLVIVGMPLTFFVLVVLYFNLSTRGYVFSDSADVSTAPVAIVFGAGLQKGGKPSRVLRARLDGSIALYRQGKVRKLLMSGDNRTRYYNEPEAMRRYALQANVPKADIIVDFAGRDTYDTCYRAKNVFGFSHAILVTQAYHAPRAVYLARGMGIDAVALAVPNLTQFPLLQMSYTGREYLADAKAWWDLSVSHRRPYVDAPG